MMCVLDGHKAHDAGNLDALLMAVSLHHLPPSHRNLGPDLAALTTKIPPQMLREPLMREAEHFSSASFFPAQLSSSSFVGATGKSPLTTLSWSLPQVSDSKPCMTMQNMLRKDVPVHPDSDKQMETLDDSHGKHFKKRCHSTNFKHYRAKKMGNTADSPNPSIINETTTMPILKSLFSKRNDNASLAPIVQGDQLEVDKHPMHLPTDPQLTTGLSRSTQISSAGHSGPPPTGMTAVSQSANVDTSKSEISRYMNVSSPSATLKNQLQGMSWFSLPLSLLRQMRQLPSSDTSLTAAERQPSESGELLSQGGAPVYTSVSNQRTVASSSLASSASPSSGTVEPPRGDLHKAVTTTKSSSR